MRLDKPCLDKRLGPDTEIYERCPLGRVSDHATTRVVIVETARHQLSGLDDNAAQVQAFEECFE